ncbi:uncharacterized protein LOC100199315 [Hydra vulgaris]|uniref:uncharacterized protein LOC100199315 n=1 Tax=Hydra vulgaris TaxID=6087 RepID=UPI001F5F3CA6|nr:uncharacterized protein LOC100199315 [Hydra vulgaris]
MCLILMLTLILTVTAKYDYSLKQDILNDVKIQLEDFEDLENDQQSQDAKFQEAHIGKIYSFENFYHSNYRIGILADGSATASLLSNGLEMFRIVRALNGRADSVSFQSAKDRNMYLQEHNLALRLHKNDDSILFKNSASFIMRNNKYYPGYFSIESSNNPGYFLKCTSSTWRLSFIKENLSDNLYKVVASYRLVRLGIVHIGKCYSFQSKNFPQYSIGIGHNDIATIRLNDMVEFCIVKALNGRGDAVSLLSANDSSKYLRQQDLFLKLHSLDVYNVEPFKNDASFILREDFFYSGYVSLESTNYPKYYIRHQSDTLKLQNEEFFFNAFKNDASFKLVQMHDSHIGKQYSFQPNDLPQYRIGIRSTETASILYKGLDEFRIVKALNGQSQYVSLQSVNDKDKYLRAQGFGLKLQSIDFTSEQFNGDASFNLLESFYYPGYVSFESANEPGYFLKHDHFTIKLLKEEPFNEKYRRAASFKLLQSSSRLQLNLALELQLTKKLQDRLYG